VTDVSVRDALVGLLVVIAVAAVVVVLIQWLARHIRIRGGPEMLARCLDGHVFKTTLVPVFLLPVPRVGLVQFRYCPVGQHWTFVVLARDY
jgi:hypothetical protein